MATTTSRYRYTYTHTHWHTLTACQTDFISTSIHMPQLSLCIQHPLPLHTLPPLSISLPLSYSLLLSPSHCIYEFGLSVARTRFRILWFAMDFSIPDIHLSAMSARKICTLSATHTHTLAYTNGIMNILPRPPPASPSTPLGQLWQHTHSQFFSIKTTSSWASFGGFQLVLAPPLTMGHFGETIF